MKKYNQKWRKAHGLGFMVFIFLLLFLTIPDTRFTSDVLANPPAAPQQFIYDPVNKKYTPAVDGAAIVPPGGTSMPSGSTSGHPQTITIENKTGVPVMQYVPEYLASNIQKPIIPVSKTYSLSATIPRSESFGFIFDNTGAAAATTLTLPHAEPGMRVGFLTVADYDLTVQPNAADTIDPFGIVTATDTVSYFGLSAGEELDLEAVGDFLQLYCYRWGRWTVVYALGSVVDDDE